ncbi:hypothetical protein RRG08_035707 [Elysia crispata]|uniref:Uncharacterized protein n=1 Tax=Elysia crispata TaxID=231223 RepID=A0AAE1CZI1_9GAST|nr:hypothetical protein RRG08_035707 [Elysia crispata]
MPDKRDAITVALLVTNDFGWLVVRKRATFVADRFNLDCQSIASGYLPLQPFITQALMAPEVLQQFVDLWQLHNSLLHIIRLLDVLPLKKGQLFLASS